MVLLEVPTVLDRVREADVVDVVLTLETEEVRSCIFQAFFLSHLASFAATFELAAVSSQEDAKYYEGMLCGGHYVVHYWRCGPTQAWQ